MSGFAIENQIFRRMEYQGASISEIAAEFQVKSDSVMDLYLSAKSRLRGHTGTLEWRLKYIKDLEIELWALMDDIKLNRCSIDKLRRVITMKREYINYKVYE